jgi:large subunit ribosomal protein L19
MKNPIIDQVEKTYVKKNVPGFEVGDSVDVAVRIVEGEKERIQVFSGTVICRRGSGVTETFTVRRIVNNEGVERIFPLHSPFVTNITVRRGGERRRAKLYYLRDRVGKAVRLAEKRRGKRDESPAGKTESGREMAASAAAS